MNRTNRITKTLLRSPTMWGALASLGFYLCLRKENWTDAVVARYCAGNWLEYVEVGLFFIALANLLIRFVDLLRQTATLHQPLLPKVSLVPRPVSDARVLLSALDKLSPAVQQHCLPRRLRDALRAVLFKGSADGLADELKYLSESESMQVQVAQSMVRIIVWAIPILGILGTVVGLTQVTSAIDLEAIDDSLAAVMSGVGVAFDTTALGLVLAMTLVILQSFVDRFYQGFLTAVETRAMEELTGRFERDRTASSVAGSLRLERALSELLQMTKAQHEELLKLGPRLIEAATGARPVTSVLAGSPEAAVRTSTEHPDQALVAIVEAIYQFNADVAALEDNLPSPLSFSGACNLLPVRLGPPDSMQRVRRKSPHRRRFAA